MGDFRIVIEGTGNHGCARDNSAGEKRAAVGRCNRNDCVECQTDVFVKGFRGSAITVARVEHWPVPGASGTTRTSNPGPVDDILERTRAGAWDTSLNAVKTTADDPTGGELEA